MANTPGKGTVLQLSISSVYTAIAQLRRVTPPNMEMGTVEITDINDTWRKFLATIKDGGNVVFAIRYDPAQATHAQLWTSFGLGTSEAWKVIFADAGVAEVGFSGIITNLGWGEANVDAIMEQELTLKVDGAVTITP